MDATWSNGYSDTGLKDADINPENFGVIHLHKDLFRNELLQQVFCKPHDNECRFNKQSNFSLISAPAE